MMAKKRSKARRSKSMTTPTRSVRKGLTKGTRDVRKSINWTARKTNKGLWKVERKLAPNYYFSFY